MLNALTHLAYSLYGVPKENQNILSARCFLLSALPPSLPLARILVHNLSHTLYCARPCIKSTADCPSGYICPFPSMSHRASFPPMSSSRHERPLAHFQHARLTDTYHYIINIVAEDAFCLGTKSRVPYMLFAETIKVPGVMFSAMEGKLKEIQAQNRMALRPVYLKQTPSRNAHVPPALSAPLLDLLGLNMLLARCLRHPPSLQS